MLLWDEGKNEASPINLLNAIWTITVNKVLRLKKPEVPIDHKKGEIISRIRVYPIKSISREVGRLGLVECIASKSFNSILAVN